ncbi:MAG: hypothetical protein AAGG01_17375 [Planctomycetota bacterium]
MTSSLRGAAPLLLAAGVLFAAPFVLATRPSFSSWVGAHDPGARAAKGPIARALGPLASVLASIEWVRFRSALQSGDPARAYAIAEHALDLDPRSERGWLELSQHLIFIRGSEQEAPALADRRRWIEEGLSVLERGEAKSAYPEELAYFAWLVRSSYLAEIPEEELGWPGGSSSLLLRGREDLARAAAAGRKGASETLEAFDESLRRRGLEPGSVEVSPGDR